jgi:hypothetical protein
MSRSRDPLEYKWRARQALTRCENYMACQLIECLAAIAANDAHDAARYASRLAHEAGYHAWVTAKFRGKPFVAPMSNRAPKDLTDYTRNRPAYD